MTGGKVRQYPYFVGLFHTSTPLRSVELSKEWQRVHDLGKVRQYPYFVRLFHTSTPLRSVELSKKWRNSGFHGQGWTWLFINLHYSIKVVSKSFDENHAYVATSYNILALVYNSLGEYNQAKELLEKALMITKKFSTVKIMTK